MLLLSIFHLLQFQPKSSHTASDNLTGVHDQIFLIGISDLYSYCRCCPRWRNEGSVVWVSSSLSSIRGRTQLYASDTISITDYYLQYHTYRLQHTQVVCKPTLCTAGYALSLLSHGHNDNVVTWWSQVWPPPIWSHLNFLCRPILRTLLSSRFWMIFTWSLRNFTTKKNQERGQFWKPEASGGRHECALKSYHARA